MNNSSAYNNVLLKSAAQTQVAQSSASVTKRNIQDDVPHASFQQRFKDAHEQVRPQNEKPVKSAVKKAAQVDNRKPANEIERKPAAPAKQTEENRSRDQVAQADNKPDNKTDQHDLGANQNSSAETNSGKESDNKEAGNKELSDKEAGKKTITTEDAATNDVTTGIANPLVAPPVAPDPLVGLAMPAEVIAAGAIDVKSIIESGFNLPASSTGSESALASSNASVTAPVAPASLPTVDQTILSDVDTAVATTTTTTATMTTTDFVTAPSQQAEVDPLSAQITPAATPVATADTVTEVAPIVLAAAGAAVVPKPVSPQASVSSALETSDADVATSLASVIPSDASTAKTATSVATPDAAVTTDNAPAQTLDVKSSFEKMMQNAARPESGARDEAQPAPAAPQAVSNSSSTNSLESMLRFSEAQTPAARSFVVQTAVPVPVGQPQWSQAVGEKVLWLAAQNVSSAEINLHPKDLGPMQVRVSVNQEQTTVSFTSHHAVVREVLDQNLNRLRDMFSEQGLNLVNVDVSDKSFSRQQGDAQNQNAQSSSQDVASEEETAVAMSAIVQQRLVDHYA